MKAATIIFSTAALASGALAAGVKCNEPKAPVSNIKNCINFLKDKGTAQCKVGGSYGGFCKDGDAVILGHGTKETNCQNIAAAAEAILGQCTSGSSSGGRSTIGGNENIWITVKHA